MPVTPSWSRVHQENFALLAAGQADFDELMKDALSALLDEDRSLSQQLGASGWAPLVLAQYSLGILSLFEPTLCFAIFRRLLASQPRHQLGWEHKYPNNKAWRADLVAHHPGGAPRWVFEAKWWLGNAAKTLEGLERDVRKLGAWSNADERFVLTFWYGRQVRWGADRASVATGIQKLAANGANTELAYVGAFACHQMDLGSDAYFAMAALRLV